MNSNNYDNHNNHGSKNGVKEIEQSLNKGKIVEIEFSFNIRRCKIKYIISKDKICKRITITKENNHSKICTKYYKKITDETECRALGEISKEKKIKKRRNYYIWDFEPYIIGIQKDDKYSMWQYYELIK